LKGVRLEKKVQSPVKGVGKRNLKLPSGCS